MHKEAIQTDLPAIGLPFSWGVKLGDLVFVAGQGPLGADGKVLEGDIRLQTRKTLENFRKVVEAAGSGLDHVLSTTVYLKNLEDFRGMNEVYSELFSAEPRPGRSPPRHEGRGPGHRLHPGRRKASIPAAHPGLDGQEEEIEEGREEESLLRGPQGKEGEEVARGYRRGIVRRSS